MAVLHHAQRVATPHDSASSAAAWRVQRRVSRRPRFCRKIVVWYDRIWNAARTRPHFQLKTMMTWKTTTFERAALYQAVWKEPVRTVAKQYGLSDVGLRKICRKLGVPVPPLGYWAKVAARQYPRIIPLPPNHKGQTAYLRRFRIDERAGERASRTKALLASIAPAAAPLSPLKDALEELHPLVRRTGARMGPRSRLANGLLESRGHDVLAMQTSEAEKERALRIADAVLTAALTSGAQLVKGAKDGQRVHLKILGEVVEIRLEEHVRHTLREPTA